MPENPKPRENKFFVDGRPYDTEKTALSGSEIKQIAGVSNAYQLFLEGKGDTPDTPISDGQVVNVEPPPKHFFAVPPATFGAR